MDNASWARGARLDADSSIFGLLSRRWVRNMVYETHAEWQISSGGGWPFLHPSFQRRDKNHFLTKSICFSKLLALKKGMGVENNFYWNSSRSPLVHAETAQAIFFDLVRKYREHKRTLIICTRTISRSFLSKFHEISFRFISFILSMGFTTRGTTEQ